MVKSVLSSLPIYSMQAMWLPQSICNSIDACLRNFIWSGKSNDKGFNLVNWDNITLPREYGGLGTTDTRLRNIGLLGKLVWNCFTQTDKPWVTVLCDKYVKQGSFLQATNTIPINGSYFGRV